MYLFLLLKFFYGCKMTFDISYSTETLEMVLFTAQSAKAASAPQVSLK